MKLQFQKIIDQIENGEKEEYLVKIKDLLSEFEKVKITRNWKFQTNFTKWNCRQKWDCTQKIKGS